MGYSAHNLTSNMSSAIASGSAAPGSYIPQLDLSKTTPNSSPVGTFGRATSNPGGMLEIGGASGGGYQPHATRPSALSPRTNGRPSSAPHYPRDSSDVLEPPFVPAEEYQLQIHKTAAIAMNSGDWQNLMVNADGSYQKHEPWSNLWVKSRGYIRAWLEFQAQADEDLRSVKDLPGVRQHTHHNEVSITQHKNMPVSVCTCEFCLSICWSFGR